MAQLPSFHVRRTVEKQSAMQRGESWDEFMGCHVLVPCVQRLSWRKMTKLKAAVESALRERTFSLRQEEEIRNLNLYWNGNGIVEGA